MSQHVSLALPKKATGLLLLGQELVQMSSPASWVVSGAVTTGFGRVQDQLDVVAHARCGDRDLLPDGVEDIDYLVGVDLLDGHSAEGRVDMRRQAVAPLLGVLAAPRGWSGCGCIALPLP